MAMKDLYGRKRAIQKRWGLWRQKGPQSSSFFNDRISVNIVQNFSLSLLV